MEAGEPASIWYDSYPSTSNTKWKPIRIALFAALHWWPPVESGQTLGSDGAIDFAAAEGDIRNRTTGVHTSQRFSTIVELTLNGRTVTEAAAIANGCASKADGLGNTIHITTDAVVGSTCTLKLREATALIGML